MNEIVSYCLSYYLLSRSKCTLNAKRKVLISDLNNKTSCARLLIVTQRGKRRVRGRNTQLMICIIWWKLQCQKLFSNKNILQVKFKLFIQFLADKIPTARGNRKSKFSHLAMLIVYKLYKVSKFTHKEIKDFFF